MTALPYACHYDSSLIPPQYWLVHRTRVDVPSMYRPRGRYRYTHGVVSLCDMHMFFYRRAFAELARCRCHGSLRAAHFSRPHRERQSRRTIRRCLTLI